MNATIHRGYLPGAIGRIVELHATHYQRAAGFGIYFESKVARELAGFCEHHDAGRDGLWLALRDGRIDGSIVIDGSRAGEEGAHLRWFIVEEGARGAGLGRALLATAIDFCRSRNYDRVYLWTFRGLDAARHLYEAAGFRLACERAGTQWGSRVDEQRFELGTRNRP